MFKTLGFSDKHLQDTRFERCPVPHAAAVSPAHGQCCPGKRGAGGAGAATGALSCPVPSPALRPLLLCVPSCSVSPPALCLAQPGRAQRRACLTYLRAPTPLRHRAAASRREAGGKRRSLPLGIPASFKGRVIGTENGHRFFLPAGREAPSNAWV